MGTKSSKQIDWLGSMGVLLLVAGGGFYIAAKLHFLSRYGRISSSQYFQEHWPFWAAAGVIGLILLILDWVRGQAARRNN